jgi:hypothetical protein
MELRKFKFKELTQADMMFSCIKTDKELLAEARARGFYGGSTKWNDKFNSLFFSGGSIEPNPKWLETEEDKEWYVSAFNYLKAFMQSFEPKHEEKEAISALILSELSA